MKSDLIKIPGMQQRATYYILIILFLTAACKQPEKVEDIPETTRNQPTKPIMKDFIGLNVHLDFKPDLYDSVTRLIRNYHPLNWDARAPGDSITLPYCANGVNWDENAYGKWSRHGFETDVCVEINPFGPKNADYPELWNNTDNWSYDYGYKMAKYFGPSGDNNMITSIEIGNEPGIQFDDLLYKNIFISMAKGIRAADPKIKIVSCNVQIGIADEWSKDISETFSTSQMIDLFDAISVHLYTFKNINSKQNPWQRSYPEDLNVPSNLQLKNMIKWRNKFASNKEIWITEFGWDAVSDTMMAQRDGWSKKLNWQDVSDLQQAQFLVRSFLFYSEKDIQRAYIFFYNDNDQPSVHAASGLTRKFKPKKSFWAIKQLYNTLGDYRFNKVIREDYQGIFIYEYIHGSNQDLVTWVLWSPTDDGKTKEIALNIPGQILSSAIMATEDADDIEASWEILDSKSIKIVVSESPIYLEMSKK